MEFRRSIGIDLSSHNAGAGIGPFRVGREFFIGFPIARARSLETEVVDGPRASASCEKFGLRLRTRSEVLAGLVEWAFGPRQFCNSRTLKLALVYHSSHANVPLRRAE
jgi:hypothetical protein